MNSNQFSKPVHSLCKRVGEYLIQTINQSEPSLKGSNDLITLADQGSEKILVEELHKICPEASILSEEMGRHKTDGRSGLTWIVDPLDGTVNYSFHIPFYCISVALLENYTPTLGIVHAPALNETFYAEKGKGAFLNGTKISTTAKSTKPLSMIATSAGMTETDFSKRTTSYHAKLLPHYSRLRLMGSQALHLCYVASGRLEAALTNQARLWDDAAGSLILTEAGGSFTNFQGNNIFPLHEKSDIYLGAPYESLGCSTSSSCEKIVSLLKN